MSKIYEYVKNNKVKLSSNEEKIKQYMLENFDKCNKTSEIAKEIYIAPSGVSRFLKKIKYKNIKHYNKDKKLEEEGIEKILEDIYLEKKKILKETFEMNSIKEIIDFSIVLSQAKIIYLYGLGYSRIEAQNIQLRLSRIGYKIILIKSRHDFIIKGGSHLINSSVFLFLSQTGETKEIIDILDFIKDNNIQTLTITNNRNSTISKFSKKTLLVPKIYSGYKIESIFSEVATALIFDLIYMVILYEDYSNSYKNYQKSIEFLNKIK